MFFLAALSRLYHPVQTVQRRFTPGIMSRTTSRNGGGIGADNRFTGFCDYSDGVFVAAGNRYANRHRAACDSSNRDFHANNHAFSHTTEYPDRCRER